MRLLIGVACLSVSDASIHYQGALLSGGARNLYVGIVGIGLCLCLAQDIVSLFRKGAQKCE